VTLCLRPLSTKVAFTDGFLRWLTESQPAGDPPIEVPIAAATAADEHDEFFRTRIEWWSGRGTSG